MRFHELLSVSSACRGDLLLPGASGLLRQGGAAGFMARSVARHFRHDRDVLRRRQAVLEELLLMASEG